MRIRVLLFVLLAHLTGVCIVSGQQKPRHDADLEPLRAFSKVYTNQLTAIEGKYQAERKRIAATFQRQLDQLESGYQKKGDLKGVVAVRAERDAFNRQFDFPGEDADADPSELRELKKTTRAYPQALDAQKRDESAALAKAYLARLTTLQTELTKKGKIDAALVVQTEVEGVTAACPSGAEAPDGRPNADHPAVPAAGDAPPPAAQEPPTAADAQTVAAALLAALAEDLRQAQTALAAQDHFLAQACFRNAQALALVAPRDADADNRETAVRDGLAACETMIASGRPLVKCRTCQGTGKVDIEFHGLAGTQPLRPGPVGTKTCTQCRGKQQIAKTLNDEEKAYYEQEAEKRFGELRAAARTQVGKAWVSALAAMNLKPRLRVVLLQHRRDNVCTECGGKGKRRCFSCSGNGWRECPRCTDGVFEETYYTRGRMRSRRIKCPLCDGKDKIPCPNCNGSGLSSSACYACEGTGKAKPCSLCNGKGVAPCYCGGRSYGCTSCGGEGERLCPNCRGVGAGSSRVYY